MIRFTTKQAPNSLTHCAQPGNSDVTTSWTQQLKNCNVTCRWGSGFYYSTSSYLRLGNARLRRFHQPYGHRLNTARHTRFPGSSSIAGSTRRRPRGLVAATLQQTLITHIVCPLNINAWYRIRWGRTSNQGNWYALRQRAVVAGPIPRDRESWVQTSSQVPP